MNSNNTAFLALHSLHSCGASVGPITRQKSAAIQPFAPHLILQVNSTSQHSLCTIQLYFVITQEKNVNITFSSCVRFCLFNQVKVWAICFALKESWEKACLCLWLCVSVCEWASKREHNSLSMSVNKNVIGKNQCFSINAIILMFSFSSSFTTMNMKV